MSKPRSGMGTWAEQAEEEDREREAAAAAAAAAGSASFPSLREAVSTKSKKKKMSLNEFYGATTGGGGGRFESKGLTPDEMLRLPTGPKERSAEEMQYGSGRLGGGFSNYGRSGGGPPPGRNRDDGDGSWGGGGRRQYGGFDEERRGPPPPRVSDYDQPSRADEVENWAMAKKPLPSFDSGPRQSRYGSLGGGSRADEVDNWAIGKKPIPSRSSTFGSGFRDPGPGPDRWTRGGNVDVEPERERPRLVLDKPKIDVGTNEGIKTNRSNPFGAARPREDVLAEKGLDWKQLEMEMEAKKMVATAQGSRPTSAQSSRPSSAQSSRSEGGLGLQQGMENAVVKPRVKVNPFGDAKPREVLLQERGQDWRKMDQELERRRVDRAETVKEKLLKEEIDKLKEQLQKKLSVSQANEESLELSGGNKPSLQDQIAQRERELEMLADELDDQVKFGQKAVERPGSAAGRAAAFPERPPSQAGSFDGSKGIEFVDRPRSRGTQDTWGARPSDERRGFQVGRERGFLGSRDFDRPRSRERW